MLIHMLDSFCKRFGITQQKRVERLAVLNFTPEDSELGQQWQRNIISPNIQHVVSAFYEKLVQYPEAQKVLSKGFSIEKLKQTQTKYILSLGLDFDTEAYFNQRLSVGYRHVFVKVQPSLYLCAYHILHCLIVKLIPPQNAQHIELLDFTRKILALDASLAMEAYEYTLRERFADSVATLQQEKESLREKVDTDTLTKVLSRERILSILNHRLIPNSVTPVSVIMADLDHFKDINDTHGHLVGDKVLKDMASRMRSTIRWINVIGRYGGEEFLIVLNDTTAQQAANIAERIRHRIAAQPIKTHDLAIPLTLSLGVAQALPNERPLDVVDRADKALYVAKNKGRNCVEISTA